MVEKFEGPRSPQPERSALDDKALVLGAMQHNISDEASRIYGSLYQHNLSQEDFKDLIHQFNELDAIERGKDKYDHSRPLTEHVDHSTTFTVPPGRTLTIHLLKSGEVKLEVPFT